MKLVLYKMACLFDSLSVFLTNNHNPVTSYELRQQICNYLSSNPNIMDDIDINLITDVMYNKPIDNYISDMRNNNTWGSAIEIKAFCEIYDIKIVVLYNSNNIEFIPSNPFEYIIYLNYTGNHYTPNKIVSV